MKKFLTKFVLMLAILHLALMLNGAIYAATPSTPAGSAVPPAVETAQSIFDAIGRDVGLPAFSDRGIHPDAPADFAQPGIDSLSSLALFVIDLMRLVLSTVAVVVIVLAALKQVGTPTEDQFGKSKSQMLWGTLGLILVQLADVLVKKMFFGEQGEIFEDAATSQEFAEESVSQIRGIIGFINLFIALVAVGMIIFRGVAVIGGGGSEESITSAKNQVIYAAIGLIVVGLSEVIIRGVVFPDAGERLPDTEMAKKVVVDMVNFLTGFVALFSFAALVYAGFQYVTSAGNDDATEKVKKIFLSATIAIILSLGAFAAANTLITFESAPQAINSEENVNN